MDYFEDYISASRSRSNVLHEICLCYGYRLDYNVTDNNKKWKYRLAPDRSGGTMSYFKKESDLRKHIQKLIIGRCMDSNSPDLEKISQTKELFGVK